MGRFVGTVENHAGQGSGFLNEILQKGPLPGNILRKSSGSGGTGGGKAENGRGALGTAAHTAFLTAPQKQGFFDKLKSIFSGGNSASDQSAPQEKEEDTALPTAEQLLGDVSDPLMLYGMETSLQMHIAELSEPLRELYVTAYTLPLTSAYINEGMVEKLSAIFSDFLPGAERKDWFACELATAGITRSYTVVPCTADYPMEQKLRDYLSCCYKIFDVPKERYEPVIERVVRIDLTETARSIIDETVREVDAGYEAAMAGLDAPNAVGG